jgi:oxygen-independent coproporphyrinogen-3 oxidase
MEASLYIHIPFCAGDDLHGKCDYCDFYSVPVKAGDFRPERFIETLLENGRQLFKKFRPDHVPTLYIGGGTPSVLGPAGIRSLLSGLSALIAQAAPPPLEITLEANPESADEAFLTAAREGGATRLSLGVQTFFGPSRRAVNRIGPEPVTDDKPLYRRLALAAEYFPHALSVGLMAGLPFQKEKILLDDISAVLGYRPAHVSLYALTVEPGTPLAVKAASLKATSTKAAAVNTAGFPLPDQDEADHLWLCGRDALEKNGYAQYEVSNFCLKGRESQHNIRYWRMRNWLALGPAASGTIIDDKTGTGFRYTFPSDLDNWFTPVKEKLDSLTLMRETFLMGFRYIEGPDADLFRRRFRKNIGECIPKTLDKWRNQGLLRKDKFALTKEGLLFLNSFLTDVFEEQDLSSRKSILPFIDGQNR